MDDEDMSIEFENIDPRLIGDISSSGNHGNGEDDLQLMEKSFGDDYFNESTAEGISDRNTLRDEVNPSMSENVFAPNMLQTSFDAAPQAYLGAQFQEIGALSLSPALPSQVANIDLDDLFQPYHVAMPDSTALESHWNNTIQGEDQLNLPGLVRSDPWSTNFMESEYTMDPLNTELGHNAVTSDLLPAPVLDAGLYACMQTNSDASDLPSQAVPDQNILSGDQINRDHMDDVFCQILGQPASTASRLGTSQVDTRPVQRPTDPGLGSRESHEQQSTPSKRQAPSFLTEPLTSSNVSTKRQGGRSLSSGAHMTDPARVALSTKSVQRAYQLGMTNMLLSAIPESGTYHIGHELQLPVAENQDVFGTDRDARTASNPRKRKLSDQSPGGAVTMPNIGSRSVLTAVRADGKQSLEARFAALLPWKPSAVATQRFSRENVREYRDTRYFALYEMTATAYRSLVTSNSAAATSFDSELWEDACRDAAVLFIQIYEEQEIFEDLMRQFCIQGDRRCVAFLDRIRKEARTVAQKRRILAMLNLDVIDPEKTHTYWIRFFRGQIRHAGLTLNSESEKIVEQRAFTMARVHNWHHSERLGIIRHWVNQNSSSADEKRRMMPHWQEMAGIEASRRCDTMIPSTSIVEEIVNLAPSSSRGRQRKSKATTSTLQLWGQHSAKSPASSPQDSVRAIAKEGFHPTIDVDILVKKAKEEVASPPKGRRASSKSTGAGVSKRTPSKKSQPRGVDGSNSSPDTSPCKGKSDKSKTRAVPGGARLRSSQQDVTVFAAPSSSVSASARTQPLFRPANRDLKTPHERAVSTLLIGNTLPRSLQAASIELSRSIQPHEGATGEVLGQSTAVSLAQAPRKPSVPHLHCGAESTLEARKPFQVTRACVPFTQQSQNLNGSTGRGSSSGSHEHLAQLTSQHGLDSVPTATPVADTCVAGANLSNAIVIGEEINCDVLAVPQEASKTAACALTSIDEHGQISVHTPAVLAQMRYATLPSGLSSQHKARKTQAVPALACGLNRSGCQRLSSKIGGHGPGGAMKPSGKGLNPAGSPTSTTKTANMPDVARLTTDKPGLVKSTGAKTTCIADTARAIETPFASNELHSVNESKSEGTVLSEPSAIQQRLAHTETVIADASLCPMPLLITQKIDDEALDAFWDEFESDDDYQQKLGMLALDRPSCVEEMSRDVRKPDQQHEERKISHSVDSRVCTPEELCIDEDLADFDDPSWIAPKLAGPWVEEKTVYISSDRARPKRLAEKQTNKKPTSMKQMNIEPANEEDPKSHLDREAKAVPMAGSDGEDNAWTAQDWADAFEEDEKSDAIEDFDEGEESEISEA